VSVRGGVQEVPSKHKEPLPRRFRVAAVLAASQSSCQVLVVYPCSYATLRNTVLILPATPPPSSANALLPCRASRTPSTVRTHTPVLHELFARTDARDAKQQQQQRTPMPRSRVIISHIERRKKATAIRTRQSEINKQTENRDCWEDLPRSIE